MSNKVVLRVKDVDNCPLYLPDERMVLAPPEVLKLNSDRICALALAKLFPLALDHLTQVNDPDYKPVGSSCPGCQGGTAHFQVEPFRSRKMGVTQRLERAAEERKEAAAQKGHNPFLSQLPPNVVKELLSACKVRKYHEPTVIVREGEEGRFFHVVGKGEVDVVKTDAGGEEIVLVILGKGECFGEMSLLTDEVASATVRTRGDNTAILSCDRSTLDDLTQRLPELSVHFNRLLIDRLRSITEQHSTEMARGMRGRLAMMPLPDVIQTLSGAGRTGTLSVDSRADGEAISGVVVFDKGNIVGAGQDEHRGDEAVYVQLLWTEGDFVFKDEEKVKSDGQITQNVTGLLMEGMRRMDEKRTQKV